MTVALGRPTPPDPDALATRIEAIAASARWSNDGDQVRELEAALAERLGVDHAIATSSGTTALTAALLALDLPPGSEVITSPLTFRATALAIEAVGCRPVFAGVDPATLLLDPAATAAAIGPRTSAILPVHLFGIAADPRLDAVAAQHRLPIVFDAAHAFDAPGLAGRATASAYSLHATKLLHTGEGGIVTTEDGAIADRVRAARAFGVDGSASAGRGINAKLPELSAALGLAVLAVLPAEIEARRRIRTAYADVVARSGRVSAHAPDRDRALLFEPVRCDPEDQSAIITELAAAGVLARAFPSLTAAGGRWGSAPIVGGDRAGIDALAASVVALPLHSGVGDPHLRAADAVLSGSRP